MSEMYISQSELETEAIAVNLAKDAKIKYGDIIALYGDLGAGKTAFTRGLTGFFAPKSRVASPTFSLVNEYNASGGKKILHFDMYRINGEDDLLSVGFYDYLEDLDEKIIVIEWFEKIADFFDEETVAVKIEKTDENSRKIIVERKLII